MAWVLRYSDGAIGLGYTAPELRRHGLASVNMEVVIRRVNEAGCQPENFGFVGVKNKASARAVSALGFQVIGLVSWLEFSPTKADGAERSRL